MVKERIAEVLLGSGSCSVCNFLLKCHISPKDLFFAFALMTTAMVTVLSWNVNNGKHIVESIQRILEGCGSDMIFISLQEHFSLHSKIAEAIPKIFSMYKVLSVCRLLGLWSIVLSKKNHDVEVMKVGLGAFGFPNKGACITKISSDLVFISCHLTAHLENNQKRLSQIRKIFECICDEKSLKDVKTVVLAGDMNFRISEPGCSNDYSTSGQFDQCNEFKKMYPMFKEGQIRFRPSYKYINNTSTFSSKRHPSWCDRIFVSSVYNIIFNEYRSIENAKSSDHKPVVSVFSISAKKSGKAALPGVKYHPNLASRGFARAFCFFQEYCEIILACFLILALCLFFVRFKPLLT